MQPGTNATDTLQLRIPDMDCPSEEAMIRRALEGMAVGSLRFDLSARTVTVQAAESAWGGIEQAIQAAGLKTERLSQAVSVQETQRRQQREMLKLGAALVLALAAELIHFLAPETLGWEIASMVVAALAIALSGFAVYRKGLESPDIAGAQP